jgi:hypothetical protein
LARAIRQIGAVPHSRRDALVVMAALAATLITSCSVAQSGAAHPSATDPRTVAQASDRLLPSGKTPGFLILRANTNNQAGPAKPFLPPQGSTNRACSMLTSPALFIPGGSVGVGESIALDHQQQRRYMPLPPSWFEWIDVYPGTEAAGIVKGLPSLLGRCGQFTFVGKTPARETAAQLPGFGDQALYVSVRLLSSVPGRFSADDWIVIRSDRTLIWIDGQYVRPPANGRDQTTLQLAQDAWHRYLAA